MPAEAASAACLRWREPCDAYNGCDEHDRKEFDHVIPSSDVLTV
jgi:hypothetical protein